MNIMDQVEKIVQKLKTDKDLLAQWKKSPVKVIEKYVGIDLPDDQVNALVDAIEAKLKLDNLGNMLGGIGNLFGK